MEASAVTIPSKESLTAGHAAAPDKPRSTLAKRVTMRAVNHNQLPSL